MDQNIEAKDPVGILERRTPRDLSAEPAYPGIDGMVMLSMTDPDWTGHLAHMECSIESGHLVRECGLWR
jgi:hypothetical protein